jgi:hypothetical protein
VKQDESNGDPKFTVTIGLGGKSAKLLKNKQKTIWKMERSMQGLQKPHIEI